MPCSSSKLLIASGTDILYMDVLASPLCLPVRLQGPDISIMGHLR